jgi:hypothetical protein
MMERDYIIGLFTLTGVVVTQFLNFIAGRYAANRAGTVGRHHRQCRRAVQADRFSRREAQSIRGARRGMARPLAADA